jgi:hypothetical protein
MLIAPAWCHTRWPAADAICADLARNGGQGSRVGTSVARCGEGIAALLPVDFQFATQST